MRRCFYDTDLGQNVVFHNFAIQIALIQYSGRSKHALAKPLKKFPKSPIRRAGSHFWQAPKSTVYCAFQKHANCKVQKPLSQLRFSLPSIIITIPSNEPWNTETHITDRNPPITNHKAWPFEPVRVKFRFLRGPSRWLTAAKNAIVSWL